MAEQNQDVYIPATSCQAALECGMRLRGLELDDVSADIGHNVAAFVSGRSLEKLDRLFNLLGVELRVRVPAEVGRAPERRAQRIVKGESTDA